MAKEYAVQVIRTYTVLDVIKVEAESDEDAKLKAEKISGNKDYTGQLSLGEVETEIL